MNVSCDILLLLPVFLLSLDSKRFLVLLKDGLLFLKTRAHCALRLCLALLLLHIFIDLIQVHEVRELFVLFEIFVSSLGFDSSLIHHDDVVGLVQEVDGVSDEDSGSIFEDAEVHIVDYLFLT